MSAVANRVTGVAPDRSAIHLEPWRDARDRFHKLAAALARRSEALVVADVRACYPSIAHSVVLRSLDRLGCTRRDVRAVMDGLRPFRGVGIRGLPVGPAPSAVLANAVLSHLDAAVRAAGHRHVRWVDDVFVFLRHPEEAGSVLELVGETLATVGLELAGEKTRVMFRSGGCGADALAYPPSMADAPGSLGG